MPARFPATGLAVLSTLVALSSPVQARPAPVPISACMPNGMPLRTALKQMPVTNTALQLETPQREPSLAEIRLAKRNIALDRLIHTSICNGC